MADDLAAWFGRIKSVEREHSAARLAIDRLGAEASRDPSIVPAHLTVRDIVSASDRLDGTYLIRLFAEFESGLRRYYPTVRGTKTPSRPQDLLRKVAALQKIPTPVLAQAQEVRELRNALVHEREETASPMPIGVARGHLCRFFSYLPRSW